MTKWKLLIDSRRNLANTMLNKSIIFKASRSIELIITPTNRRLTTLVNNVFQCTHGSNRSFCVKKGSGSSSENEDVNITKSTHPGLATKYSVFRESDAPILLDVYEEKILLHSNEDNALEEEKDEFYGLNLNRGVHGVFDLEDLIELLKRDKAEDIFVALLPPEAKYVDYIVIVNGRSIRHMIALAEIVRRVFKKKKMPNDIIPKIEGENSKDWLALDLGNIALHIFSHKAREFYDLESLWSVGPEFDPLMNAPDEPLIALLKKHSISLKDISSKGELL